MKYMNIIVILESVSHELKNWDLDCANFDFFGNSQYNNTNQQHINYIKNLKTN